MYFHLSEPQLALLKRMFADGMQQVHGAQWRTAEVLERLELAQKVYGNSRVILGFEITLAGCDELAGR